MVNDITSAVQGACNYLAATGLITYTEACGRRVFFAGDTRVANHKCLVRFMKHMGVDAILEEPVLFRGNTQRFQTVVRHGLVHEYFMKSQSGGVAMISPRRQAQATGFLVKSPKEVWFVVVPYFNKFCAALAACQESGQLEHPARSG